MKRLLLVLLLLTSLYCQALTYIDVRLNVAEQGGTKPSTCVGIAYITRDATNNPMHTVLRVEGVYNAAGGYLSWTLPDGCYAKFEVRYVALYDTFHIVDDGDQIIYLNDLIPALPPPPPNWAIQYFVPYTGANSNVNLGSYNLTANIGTFQSVATSAVSLGGVDLGTTLSGLVPYTGAKANLDLGQWSIYSNAIYLTNGQIVSKTPASPLPVLSISNYDGTVYNQNFLEINIDRSKILKINEYGTLKLSPVGDESFSLELENGEKKGIKFADGIYGNILQTEALTADVSSVLPAAGGLVWTDLNDGSGSGLDADLLDGNESSYYEKALTFSSPLSRTVDTVSITQSSATTDGYLSSADWNTFNSKVSTEEDGIIGNEIIGALDTTLTRHGQGTTANPFKLALTLSNPNIWTANQTAPNFLSSQTYDPNAPVSATFPSGYPNNGNGADPKNEEFNGSFNHTFAYMGGGGAPTTNFNTPGYLTFTAGNGLYYMVDLDADKLTGDFDVAMHIAPPCYGSHIGLALGTDGSEAGGIHTYVIAIYWAGASYFSYKSAKNVGWVAGDETNPLTYATYQYLRIKRVSNEVTYYVSVDGYCWTQTLMRDVSTSSNVWYITESTPIQYFGIYYTINGGGAVHAPAGTIYTMVDWIRWK